MKKLYMIKGSYGRGKIVGPYHATKASAKLARKELNRTITNEDGTEQEVFEHQIKLGPDHWNGLLGYHKSS